MLVKLFFSYLHDVSWLFLIISSGYQDYQVRIISSELSPILTWAGTARLHGLQVIYNRLGGVWGRDIFLRSAPVV